MEIPVQKRMSAGVTLTILSPGLVAALSGCAGNTNTANCDNNRSTLTTSDDCGVRRRVGGGFVGGGFIGTGRQGQGAGAAAPSGGSAARSGGFGRFFSGGS